MAGEFSYILASASPRRHELLHLVVPHFTVCAPQVDESTVQGDTPATLALALAKLKCLAVAPAKEQAVVIGCDTVVSLDGKALGKPEDETQAREMLQGLSARAHFVHTGVCIAHGGQHTAFVETTKVFFSPLTAQEIDSYVQTGDPMDKAGAYGVQGGAAKFVYRMEGCYFNVMGLPVSAIYRALKRQELL